MSILGEAKSSCSICKTDSILYRFLERDPVDASFDFNFSRGPRPWCDVSQTRDEVRSEQGLLDVAQVVEVCRAMERWVTWPDVAMGCHIWTWKTCEKMWKTHENPWLPWEQFRIFRNRGFSRSMLVYPRVVPVIAVTAGKLMFGLKIYEMYLEGF